MQMYNKYLELSSFYTNFTIKVVNLLRLYIKKIKIFCSAL